MLRIHAVIRLVSTILLVAAVFIAESIRTLLPIYALVLLTVLLTRVSVNHFRFVVFITTPLLVALLLMWGWMIEARQVPAPHQSGIDYALFLWLRVIASGGLLQCLFVPLTEQPAHLKNFLERIGSGTALSTLILSSITFLPEIRSRVNRITDARRAQGHALTGLKGLLELPTILMPLVSSLLDSAAQRAELLSHRGLLDKSRGVSREIDYSSSLSALVFVVALSVLVSVSLVRFYP